ncbi:MULTISPECIES: DUF3153 domain-containing protein [Cyanophyceae]|uniref:DUF3153 domain-containing protein n=1 Tax=Cyanophyceae TaxID=3028117 RepID=UPI001684A10A|nr:MULTISPECIES: DUF3153 domain-containing protein [Cyanophyceae]MBD1916392.1 DUF3153 domain-containing protein [Phormidium sp. FACHB-77]MBD2032684.1 DUF3153 domain-containing protein [Phormidium sp. FACHB-322]MBD2050056.1 DUF3153 domain-containing protein [Leptolyngbya sp. FACHB-60]
MQFVHQILRRFAQLPLRETLLLLLPLLLSGCLRYDLTLRFDHQSHGQISQTIDLSDRGAALAQPTLAPWLEELKVRSRPLGGQLSQNSQTVTLTVPFGTANDLGDRFQQLFASASDLAIESAAAGEIPPSDRPTYLQVPGWEPVPFALDIDQTNWLLASRTHLTYTLDLRQLPPNGDSSADPAPWADLRFRLQVPWGLAQLAPTATPPIQQDATGATWQLEPGQITFIDAAFWLPNAIALGTLGIAALVLAGYGLRYRIFKPKFPTP